jgi:hypothetical protein
MSRWELPSIRRSCHGRCFGAGAGRQAQGCGHEAQISSESLAGAGQFDIVCPDPDSSQACLEDERPNAIAGDPDRATGLEGRKNGISNLG